MIKKSSIFKKHWLKFILAQIVFTTLLFSLPLASFAQTRADNTKAEKEATQPLDFTPQITIPNSEFIKGDSVLVGLFNKQTGKMESDLLARYIIAIFNYALAAVAILATIVLMGAGIIWLTSGGESGKITKAKQLIGGSITGMIILACSWIILNTINPELTKLQSIDTKILEPVAFDYLTCCDPVNGPITISVKSVDGKKVYLDGEKKGQEATCPNESLQCQKGDICVNYGEYNFYSCVPDMVCCQCNIKSLGLVRIHECVEKPVSLEHCREICAGENSWARGTVYYQGFSAETHACSLSYGECRYKK